MATSPQQHMPNPQMVGSMMPTSARYSGSASRYVVGLVFSLSTALSAFQWIEFSPIQPLISDMFGVDSTTVNLLAMSYYILYLPASLLSVYLMERFGLATTLGMAACLQVACTLVKLGGTFAESPSVGFGAIMVGQVLAAIAQPLIENVVPRISADWFPESERNHATVVMTQANVVGQLTALLSIPSIVSDMEGLRLLSGSLVFFCGIAAVLTALFVRDRPPSPPSASAKLQWATRDFGTDFMSATSLVAVPLLMSAPIIAKVESETPTPTLVATAPNNVTEVSEAWTTVPTKAAPSSLSPSNIISSSSSSSSSSSGGISGSSNGTRSASAAVVAILRDGMVLFRNRNFVLLNASFSIGAGIAWTLLTVQAQLLTPCGYNATEVGAISSALLGLGVFTSLALAHILTRTHAYLLTQRTIAIGCLVATILVVMAVRVGSFGIIFAAWMLLGAFIQPLFPLTLEHASEITFPIPADTSSTVLHSSANVVGLVLTFAIGPLLALPKSAQCTTAANPAGLFFILAMLLGALFVMPLRADNRRRAADSVAESNPASPIVSPTP